MFEWIGYPCIETLDVPCSYDNPISIVFFSADKSKYAAMICSAIVSSSTLIYASGVRVGAGIPLLWCPRTCTKDMLESID